MGRVSRKIIDKELQKQLEAQLSFIISSLTNKKEIEVFLNEFLTKEEKVMLGKRLILYMLLEKGWTSTQIYRVLGMSYETIRWYKALFESKPDLFKITLQKLIKREKSRELWEKFEKIFETMTLALQAKTNIKARAKLAQGNAFKNS